MNSGKCSDSSIGGRTDRNLLQGLPAEQLTILKKEFNQLSFLWGDNTSDAAQENMSDWKKTVLFGPKVRALAC